MNLRLFLGGVTVAMALGIVLDAGMLDAMDSTGVRRMAVSISARGMALIFASAGAALAELKR